MGRRPKRRRLSWTGNPREKYHPPNGYKVGREDRARWSQVGQEKWRRSAPKFRAHGSELAKRVLKQKRGDSQKVYSLHESEVYCLSKGKEHKKCEFGAKASVVVGENHGVILGA